MPLKNADAILLNTLAAAVVVVPTLATGIVAWQWQLAGQKLKGLLLLHLVLGFTSSEELPVLRFPVTTYRWNC
jgi:hypothetical protein